MPAPRGWDSSLRPTRRPSQTKQSKRTRGRLLPELRITLSERWRTSRRPPRRRPVYQGALTTNPVQVLLHGILWCPRGDLNPHALKRALAPQASASTYSATRTGFLSLFVCDSMRLPPWLLRGKLRGHFLLIRERNHARSFYGAWMRNVRDSNPCPTSCFLSRSSPATPAMPYACLL